MFVWTMVSGNTELLNYAGNNRTCNHSWLMLVGKWCNWCCGLKPVSPSTTSIAASLIYMCFLKLQHVQLSRPPQYRQYQYQYLVGNKLFVTCKNNCSHSSGVAKRTGFSLSFFHGIGTGQDFYFFVGVWRERFENPLLYYPFNVNHVFCIDVSVQLVSPDAFTLIDTIQHSILPYAVKINMC